jgi:hypothetical protein
MARAAIRGLRRSPRQDWPHSWYCAGPAVFVGAEPVRDRSHLLLKENFPKRWGKAAPFAWRFLRYAVREVA